MRTERAAPSIAVFVSGAIIVSVLALHLGIIGVAALSIGDLPQPVQETLQTFGDGEDPVEIEREFEGDLVFYEAEYREEGVEREIRVDAEGRIVETEMEISVSDIPSVVRESLLNRHKDVEIEEVERITLTHYEVEVELENDQDRMIRILENGHVLDGVSGWVEEEEDEERVKWSDLPQEAQEAFNQHKSDAKPESIERYRTQGQVYFEAEYETEDDHEEIIVVDNSGRLIEIEREMPTSDLPSSIREKILDLHEGAEIEEVLFKRSTLYEVELEIEEDGDEEEVIEVRVLANGAILSEKDDD